MMNSPPAVSCQPVMASGPTPSGRPQRLVITVPAPMEAEEITPAMTPTASSRASAVRTTMLTPNAPTTAASTVRRLARSPRTSAASPTTNSGPAAPITAATPPGSR